MTQTTAPILLGLASALTWGGADFAGGMAAKRGNPGTIVFVAHGISLSILCGLILLTHPQPLGGIGWAWGLLSGAAGGIALMLFYEALAEGAMGLSAALAGVLTAALPVGVSIIRKGPPGAWQMAGFLTAAVAIGLIAWSPELPVESHSSQETSLRSLVLAASAGLGFGVQLVVLHLASANGSVLRALTLSRAGGAAAGATAMLIALVRGRGGLVDAQPRMVRIEADHKADYKANQNERQRLSPARAFLGLAVLAGLLDTAGNGLYMSAALAGRLDVAAVLASLYPGATILLAIWLLHERATRTQAAGMALALVAVALISA